MNRPIQDPLKLLRPKTLSPHHFRAMETWIPTKLATPDKDGEAGVDEAGDKDDEGWSQKEKREEKRSRDKKEKK